VDGARARERLRQLSPRHENVVLLVAALAAYAIEARAWPLYIAGDMDEYLLNYLQLPDGHPLLPYALAYRAPVAGLVTGGALDLGGGLLAVLLAATFFATSILLWVEAARTFGRRAGITVGIALLLYPGYAGMFHEYGAEMVFAVSFAAWALFVCRAVADPSTRRFAVAGLGIALLALIRPGNAVVAILALFPLVLHAPWRRRLTWVAATAAAAIIPMGLWTVHNGVVLGDYAFARGSDAIIPFYRVFLADRLIAPDNGPASRRLQGAIERDLVTREPYVSYGITTADVFARPSSRVHEDLLVLSDEVWGWDSAYATLRSAAIEGIRKHPGTYVSGVFGTVLAELHSPFYRAVPSRSTQQTDAPAVVVVRGRQLPAPSEGQLIPGGQNIWISTPDQRIRQVWSSSTGYHFVFTHPGDQRRFDRIEADLGGLFRKLQRSSADGNATLATQLNRASRWYPKPLYLAAIGLVLLVVRRPRRVVALVVPPIAALGVITLTALGDPADMHRILPVAPAFFFFCAGALFGQRGRESSDT
jgi:hypothetical protein